MGAQVADLRQEPIEGFQEPPDGQGPARRGEASKLLRGLCDPQLPQAPKLLRGEAERELREGGCASIDRVHERRPCLPTEPTALLSSRGRAARGCEVVPRQPRPRSVRV